MVGPLIRLISYVMKMGTKYPTQEMIIKFKYDELNILYEMLILHEII